MEEVNNKLKEYIKENVFVRYDYGGHGKDHIEYVVKRCFEIIDEFNLDVDKNMIYAVAAYHDIGYRIDPDRHEEVSSEIFKKDENMKKFFTDEQIDIMADAIVDHRASLEYEARNIYGKIVSSADREISVENMLQRSFLYQEEKHKSENPEVIDVINYSYKKLSSKYGKGGYAKMYYPDKKYKDYLNTMQDLLENKDKFIEAEMKIAKNLGRL